MAHKAVHRSQGTHSVNPIPRLHSEGWGDAVTRRRAGIKHLCRECGSPTRVGKENFFYHGVDFGDFEARLCPKCKRFDFTDQGSLAIRRGLKARDMRGLTPRGIAQVVARVRVGDYIDEADERVTLSLTTQEASWLHSYLSSRHPDAKALNARIARAGTHLNNPSDLCFIAGELAKSTKEATGIEKQVAIRMCRLAQGLVTQSEGRKFRSMAQLICSSALHES